MLTVGLIRIVSISCGTLMCYTQWGRGRELAPGTRRLARARLRRRRGAAAGSDSSNTAAPHLQHSLLVIIGQVVAILLLDLLHGRPLSQPVRERLVVVVVGGGRVRMGSVA